jgi:hypothetical protein
MIFATLHLRSLPAEKLRCATLFCGAALLVSSASAQVPESIAAPGATQVL